ncbi:hypothetical protein MPH_03887 [Macrophomina phaseolina MS6]|uniref:Uncharacterized protein n=1 Tax=Macrophomina phaseolina (strain MS6) TaxID=1126212 RepID=K2R8V2_MACPH|nr:hypothetical protein MPH_03887 [Macrophomina phaseolina MS6]
MVCSVICGYLLPQSPQGRCSLSADFFAQVGSFGTWDALQPSAREYAPCSRQRDPWNGTTFHCYHHMAVVSISGAGLENSTAMGKAFSTATFCNCSDWNKRRINMTRDGVKTRSTNLRTKPQAAIER